MKLKNILLAIVAAGAALVACTDPNQQLGTDTFEVSQTEDIVIPQAGGSVEFTVTSSFDWNIRGVDDAADWLNVEVDGQSVTSKASVIKASSKAQTVSISALANDGKDRSVTLTVFADIRNQVSIKVSQAGKQGDGIITTTVADLIANPSTTETYRLSGTVSGYNSNYGSFDLTDATGTIYVYSMEAASKAEWASKIKNGGTITITGQYEYYEQKQQHEIVKAVVEQYTAPEGGDPDQAKDATVAEFIEKADVVGYYKLSGTISGFNSQYCSFDLTDETGTIYVYSVEQASKDQYSSVLKNGYKVVIRGQYAYYAAKQQHEVVNAIIDSYEEAQAEQNEVTGLVVAISKAGFLVRTANGISYVYDTNAVAQVKLGDNVTVKGEVTTYNGVTELVNCEVTVNSSGNEVVHPDPTVLDAAAFDSYNTLFGYVQFEGKLSQSGNYYNLKVKDAARTGSLSQAVSVDASLVDKWVVATGYFVGISGSSYFNIIYTDLTLSENQHEGEEEEEAAEATVGENEVGYELTNAEIIASLTASSATGDVYADWTFASAAGDWTGNVDTKKTITYVQFRNNRSSHLKSPVYEKNVKRIVLRFQEQTSSRTVHAVPVSVIPNLPSQKDDNYNKTAHSDLFQDSFGSVQSGNKEECTKVIKVTGETKEFALIALDGAVYLNSILVICEK